MHKVLPIFYSEYGRYITRHRAIPNYIDCLKPIERRIILALRDVAQRKVKSSKVIGHLIAHYHPHGDLSAYDSLVHMVQQGYALAAQGNFGSPGLIDAKASAHRYTETKLAPWLKKYAFEYYKYVPWKKIETDEKEPLYLPCPIPLGLIGNGITLGISFHRTLIPKYKKEDLLKRLKHLVKNNDPKDCIIKPHIIGCNVTETIKDSFFDLLTTGKAQIKIIPKGTVTKKEIRIHGRSPLRSFKSLITACEPTKKNNKKIPPKLNVNIDDLSGETLDVCITPKKRSIDTLKIAKKIWSTYLISNTNFNCLVSDEEGFIQETSIDQLILNSYKQWKLAVLTYNLAEYDVLNKHKIENKILEIVNYIIKNYNLNNTADVLKVFNKQTRMNKVNVELLVFDMKTETFQKSTYTIIQDDILKCCTTNSIKKLIEFKSDSKLIESELNIYLKKITDNENHCFKLLADFQ